MKNQKIRSMKVHEQSGYNYKARVEKALEDAGVPKESIHAGPKELLKEVDGKLIPLVYMLMGAQTYLKFVQKRRDYKYIVSAANTAKPMIAISVSDLDKNENLIKMALCIPMMAMRL